MNSTLIQLIREAKDSQKDLLCILVITLVTLLCFANSLSGEFIFDDFVVIQDNPNIKSLSNIFDLFLQSYWGTNPSSGNYRPLTNVSFALNFAISSSNSYSYHLVNILFHTINCGLIYYLCNHYCQRKLLSLFCGLFFAVHPLHSEAVAAIYARPEILATMFLLIAWLCYLVSTKNTYYYIFSLLSYFLSLLSKESGITLIGILLLVEICLKSSWLSKIKSSTKILGYILVTIIYLIIRIYVTQTIGFPTSGQFFANETFLTRLYTMSLGYVEYFKLLVWPAKLYTEYDYSVIPKATTLDLSVALSLLLIILIVILGIWQIKKNSLIAFAILFFFVTTSIVSNIFIPTGILIAERTIYLPVASICLLLAAILYQIYIKGWQRVAITGFILILSLATIRTYLRNFDFQSDFTFFSSIIKLVPNHPKGNYGLGLYYEHINDFAKAEVYFKKALELSPNSALIHVIIGNLYNKQGRSDMAMAMFKKAISLNANDADAHSYYGAGLIAQGNLCEAKVHLKKAISLNKNLAKAHNNLGIVYAELNMYLEATSEFETAINLDPEYFQAKENLKLLKETPSSKAKPINCPE